MVRCPVRLWEAKRPRPHSTINIAKLMLNNQENFDVCSFRNEVNNSNLNLTSRDDRIDFVFLATLRENCSCVFGAGLTTWRVRLPVGCAIASSLYKGYFEQAPSVPMLAAASTLPVLHGRLCLPHIYYFCIHLAMFYIIS